MNSDIIHTEEKWKKGDARILIIDKLLSRGWTSYFDMNVALFRELNGETKTIAKLDDKGLQEYCFEHQEYTNNIKVSDIPHMIDVWALIRRGVDIEGILEREKKNGRKVSENPIRDEMRQNFIEVHKIDPDNEEELTEHNLSDATLYYLKKGNTNGQSILVFRYKEQGYSIREDLLNYNKEQNTTRFSRNIDSGITYDMSDVGKYNLIPDPDVIARKRRALLIKVLQDELIRDTTGAVRRRLEIINGLKKAKPQGWMSDTSNTYLNAIYDGQGILEGLELGPILHKYGSHLLDSKEYNQGQSFLQEGLDAFRETMLAGNDKAKEEYALILQNLAAIHITLGNYSLAENEAVESLELFRNLSRKENQYQYGIALLQNTLAGIHIGMRKLEPVENEYNEAIRIYSQLSEKEPTKYLYLKIESNTSLARFFHLMGRMEESIEKYEMAMPLLEKLTERNFDDFAPQWVTAMINFSIALQDSGIHDRAEDILLKALRLIQKLDEKNPGIFMEELSTVYHNLGVLLVETGKLSQAENYLSEAEQIRRELIQTNSHAYNGRLAATLDIRAKIDKSTGNLGEAINKWKEALSLLNTHEHNEINDLTYKNGEYLFYIGSTYMELEDTENALLYLHKAESVFREMYNKNSSPKMFEDYFAMTLMCLGEIYNTIEGKEDDAEMKLKESLDVAMWFYSNTDYHDITFLVEILLDYGFFLFQKERFEEAKGLCEQAIMYGEYEISKKDNINNDINELVATARELLNTVEDNLSSPQESKKPNTDYCTKTTDNNHNVIFTTENPEYSSEEAFQHFKSNLDKIAHLKKNDIQYREKCRKLYNEVFGYCTSLEDKIFLADYLFSVCEFLSEECDFEPIEKIGKDAVALYEEALSKDNTNMPLRLKYIKAMSVYCKSLEEYDRFDCWQDAIVKVMEFTKPVEINLQNDIECTYAALKNELLHDYFSCISSEHTIEAIQSSLHFYQHVSSPNKAMMCRFLTKAATTCCENEEWEQAEKNFDEAEKLMLGCDSTDLDNRLCMGILFTLKGRYIHLTPLKWPNHYEDYSHEKAENAFLNAKKILEGGIKYNPVLFNKELLNLLHAKLQFHEAFWITDKQKAIDTAQYMLNIMNELCEANEYVFSWRSLEAYLEIAKAMTDIDFSLFYENAISVEKLESLYKKRKAMYDEMPSMICIYKEKNSDLYKNLISKIKEAKKELIESYHTAVE